MNYYDLVKQALHYEVGDLNPIEDLIDIHRHEKFLFEFPASAKKSLNIYLYDESINIYHDFENAALKVYENGEWFIQGVWVEQLDEYFSNLESEIQENIDRLEQERVEAELEEERRIHYLVLRFRILFGEDLEEAVFSDQEIPENKTYSVDVEFPSDMPMARFLQEFLDAEVTLIPVVDEDELEEGDN